MQWFKITAQTADSAELLLYGTIGDGWFDDNSSISFANTLQGLKNVSNITLRINSPGGEVVAAQAIYNLIKSHSAYVTVIIDGLAASAASLVAMAGNRIIMPSNAILMIHNPSAYVIGDSAELTHAAEVLQKTKETMIAVYAQKTGKSTNELSKLMDSEKWFTAQEALDYGLIDEIDSTAIVNYISGANNTLTINGLSVEMQKYKNMPIVAMTNPTIPQKKGKFIMTAEQLKSENPAIYNQIYNQGVTDERSRIKAIDSINVGAAYDSIKHKAKYETFQSSGEAAIAIINAQTASMKNTSAAIADDIKASGVNSIPMGEAPFDEQAPEQTTIKGLIQKAIAAANSNIQGGVK